MRAHADLASIECGALPIPDRRHQGLLIRDANTHLCRYGDQALAGAGVVIARAAPGRLPEGPGHPPGRFQVAHLLAVQHRAWIHRDPVDRLLLAQTAEQCLGLGLGRQAEQAIDQVGDAGALGRGVAVGAQLAPHHRGPQVGQLDPQRPQHLQPGPA